MSVYVAEDFSPEEEDILRRYVTNLDRPVFALVNLPEVVKGALFARYSRSSKSLRRLFLDEFVGDLDISGDAASTRPSGSAGPRSSTTACSSSTATTRLPSSAASTSRASRRRTCSRRCSSGVASLSYLEQSTRYIAYDVRLGGRYRYYRDPAVLASSLGTRYVGDLDRLFDTYGSLVGLDDRVVPEVHPKDPNDSDFVYRQAVRAKAFDSARGVLPSAAISNVGIYASGQAFEMLLLRMRAHPLPEARAYAELMLEELRKVIPSFLKRVDVADRGGAWTQYLEQTRHATEREADLLLAGEMEEPVPSVTLTDFDPDAEDKLLAAILYPHSDLPDHQLLARVRRLTTDERMTLLRVLRGRADQPPAQARASVRARRLPVRRPGRLRRVPRPAAASHAHHRVAAALSRVMGTSARPRSTTPATARSSTPRWSARPTCTERCSSSSRSRRPTPSPWRTASASPCR